VLELAFQPDRGRPEPLYHQLAEYLNALVAADRLPEGERLPATRELASLLQLSRNTVTQAYGLLVERGVLLSHVGQGTFVASRGAASPSVPELAPADRAFAWEGLFAQGTRRVPVPRSALGAHGSAAMPFDFTGGQVDAESLPVAELRRAYRSAITRHLPAAANHRDPLGWPALRSQVARLLVTRGIGCGPDDIVITSGAQQALDFVARALIDPGDAAIVEQPGYFGATLALKSAGAHLLGVGVDAEGLRVDELARLLRTRRAKLVYTTPAAQLPTGAILSDPRRAMLLELADRYQVPVVEDDYDSEFRFADAPIPALKTRDAAGQVIYVGTFSKALFPGMRLGYAVAAPALLARIAQLRGIAGFGSDVLAQIGVTEMLTTGALERHVRRMRTACAERRDALATVLRTEMPDGVRFTAPRGGHTLWLEVPGAIDPDSLQAAAAAAGVVYTRGDAFSIDGRFAHHIALAFTHQPADRLALGASRLADCVRAELARADSGGREQ
jgi:GntR family transcriptional regulator/MocR family aminotransferase